MLSVRAKIEEPLLRVSKKPLFCVSKKERSRIMGLKRGEAPSLSVNTSQGAHLINGAVALFQLQPLKGDWVSVTWEVMNFTPWSGTYIHNARVNQAPKTTATFYNSSIVKALPLLATWTIGRLIKHWTLVNLSSLEYKSIYWSSLYMATCVCCTPQLLCLPWFCHFHWGCALL